MKAIFRADYSRGGFITSTLAPCDRRNEPRFSIFRGLALIGLVFGFAAMLRLLISH